MKRDLGSDIILKILELGQTNLTTFTTAKPGKIIMLKISVPFRAQGEVFPLIEAGADQLYCGYLPLEWEKKFTNMEFERKGGGSNFTDIKEFKSAVDLSHKKGVSVFLALNGLYVNSQYSVLRKIVREMEAIDFDAYIIADLGLLLLLRELKTKKQMHLSTGATVFNAEAVDFYRKLGISNIVFDRQTTIKEMGAISMQNPDISFEAFILNTLCVHIDGFCTFLHACNFSLQELIARTRGKKLDVVSEYDPFSSGDACCLNYSCGVRNPSLNRSLRVKKIRPTFYKKSVNSTECGACALYDIAATQIKTVKIVGRQLGFDERLRSVKFIRSSLDFLERNKNMRRHDFINKVQALYRQTYGVKVSCKGNNCYHPDVILKK